MPFDYHPSSATISAPKIKQAVPSALQKANLRNVDTGPDSLKGARFRDTPQVSAIPDNAPRVIFTNKLVQHERDVLVPYLHSEKIINAKKTDEAMNDEDSSGDPAAKRQRQAESGSGSGGTNAQLNAGAEQQKEKEEEDPVDISAAIDEKYIRTAIPGLVFDKNVGTTLRSAYLPWILFISLVFGLLIVLGFGTWGAATFIDLSILLLVLTAIVIVAASHKGEKSTSTQIAQVLAMVREHYHSNPTLWQSELIHIAAIHLISLVLDITSMWSVAIVHAVAWFVVITDVIYLAAKHWVHVDIFDMLPADWYTEPVAADDTTAPDAAIPDAAIPDAAAVAASVPLPTSEVEEVFHVAGNKYTYGEAADVCSSLGAKLANYDQLEDAYNNGAEFCEYGWSDSQMALFPTQKQTWTELQKSSDSSKRQSCGRPGVNGGWWSDPKMKFGVNCFGVKPAATDGDVASTPLKGGGTSAVSGGTSKYTRDQLKLQSFNRDSWSGGVAPNSYTPGSSSSYSSPDATKSSDAALASSDKAQMYKAAATSSAAAASTAALAAAESAKKNTTNTKAAASFASEAATAARNAAESSKDATAAADAAKIEAGKAASAAAVADRPGAKTAADLAQDAAITAMNAATAAKNYANAATTAAASATALNT